MSMSSKKPKSMAKSASRKVVIKDLKAKDAGSVKGGVVSRFANERKIVQK